MDTLPSTATISSSINPKLPHQGPIIRVNPMHTPTTDNWLDEMDVTDSLPPTAPSPNPLPHQIFPPFLLQSWPRTSPSHFKMAPLNPPSLSQIPPTLTPKKTRNYGTSNLQWLQLLSNLNHMNNNPLRWIEVIGAVTQILTISVDNITSTQSDDSIISKKRVHIKNITDQLISAATKLRNSASYPTSLASAQTSLELKINEIHRKINTLAKAQSSPTMKTYIGNVSGVLQGEMPKLAGAEAMAKEEMAWWLVYKSGSYSKWEQSPKTLPRTPGSLMALHSLPHSPCCNSKATDSGTHHTPPPRQTTPLPSANGHFPSIFQSNIQWIFNGQTIFKWFKTLDMWEISDSGIIE